MNKINIQQPSFIRKYFKKRKKESTELDAEENLIKFNETNDIIKNEKEENNKIKTFLDNTQKNDVDFKAKENILSKQINLENITKSYIENKLIINSKAVFDSENINDMEEKNDPIYIEGNKLKINIEKIKSNKNYKFKSTFFNLIKINTDGNCLYRSISFIILHSQAYYDNIRKLVFNYINNNKQEFY